MMYCPRCNARNNASAKYCVKCGTRLIADTVSSNDSNVQPSGSGFGVVPGPTQPSRTQKNTPLVIVCAALVVVLVGLLGWKAWEELGPKPEKETSTIASLLEQKDGKALLNIRTPKDTQKLTVRDEHGNVLKTIDASSMKDSGNGYLETDVSIDAPDADALKGIVIIAEWPDDDGISGSKTESNSGRKETVQLHTDRTQIPNFNIDNQNGNPSQSNSGNVIETTEPGTWILADACDWLDKQYGADKKDAEAAKALAEHLATDGRVASVKQYGNSVLFSAKAADDKSNPTLCCINLDPVTTGMLGAASDHTFSQEGPALNAFETFESKKQLEPGLGITAGNTITSGDVLILEPTPEKMKDDSLQKIEAAAKAYATSLGGAPVIKKGSEALLSLLNGDMYGTGVVVLRAHGIEVPQSGTMFLQMHTASKELGTPWEDLLKKLNEYFASLEKSPVNTSALFEGNADNPKGWQCAITARATEESGKWDVGISATPHLISTRYDKPLDECIFWLSACGGFADDSFVQWAANDASGIQYAFGYKDVVKEDEDANKLSQVLTSLVDKSGSNESWRSKNISEAMGEPSNLLGAQDDQSQGPSNLRTFSSGKGSITGTVVNKNGEALGGIDVEAWLYFDGTYLSKSSVQTTSDGAFLLKNLTCGRYVLVVSDDNVRELVTIVLDEKTVDGGTIKLDVAKKTSGTSNSFSTNSNKSNVSSNSTSSSSISSRDSSSKVSSSGSSSNTTTQTIAKPKSDTTASLGAANVSVVADDEFYYLAVRSSSVPKVVRISRNDSSKSNTLLEGTKGDHFEALRKVEDMLFVVSSSQKGTASLMTVKTDGSNTKTILGPSNTGGNESGKSFVCTKNHVFYNSTAGKKWSIRSCGLNGSADKLLCEGTSKESTVHINVLSVKDGSVFFAVRESDESTVLYSVPLDGGKQTKLITVESAQCPQILGDHIYTLEENEFVSYSLKGEDRKVLTTLKDANDAYILNMNADSAYVVSKAKNQDDNTLWLISLKKDRTEKLGTIEYHSRIDIVDKELVITSTDGTIQSCDTNLKKIENLWPNK